MKASNIALVGSVMGVAAVIFYVHNQQTTEKARMHQGVIRDEERRLRKLASSTASDSSANRT
jgi:uncharacterized membrane protein YccC